CACPLARHAHSRHENRHDKSHFPKRLLVILERLDAIVLPTLVNTPNPRLDGVRAVGWIGVAQPRDALNPRRIAAVGSESGSNSVIRELADRTECVTGK